MEIKTRHAFLIMAHAEPEMLRELIDEIDDERADIFVHIDRKAPFDGSELTTAKSKLTVLPKRIDGRWGDYSLVEIELELLKAATDNDQYARYHLISGMDMLTADIDSIIAECSNAPRTEFIAIARNVSADELRYRSQHRFLFPGHFRSKNPLLRAMRKAWAMCQSAAGYRRCPLPIAKGSQWWSITGSFARYCLDHASWIEEWFRGTYCPDEMVFQTLCMNSEFAADICRADDEFEGNRRYIKWENGQLMPLTDADLTEARRHGRWFARKRPALPEQ